MKKFNQSLVKITNVFKNLLIIQNEQFIKMISYLVEEVVDEIVKGKEK